MRRDWKTSLFGVVSIMNGVQSVISNPQDLFTDAGPITPIIVGLGLLFARDGKIIKTRYKDE